MNRAEAEKILADHLALYRGRPYAELAGQVGSVVGIEAIGASGVAYGVEIEIRWDSPQRKTDVRVLVAVDDHRWPAGFRPVTDSFIVAPDGRFIGE
jgi:hypothetical protein